MKEFTAKVDFSKLFYAMDFSVSTMFFTKDNLYISYAENWEYIVINECIFCKYSGSGNIEYVYEYFYTDRELRKLKLEKINESR